MTQPNNTILPASAKPTAPASEPKMMDAVILGTREDTASIRPFEFHASDEDLADLKRRILTARWPERETIADDTQGVPLALMQNLARYWATEYD